MSSESLAAYQPDLLYRSLVYGSPEPPPSVQTLALPGQRLDVPLRAGDAILRVALGEPRLGHLAVLADGRLLTRDELVARQATPETERPGQYAIVVEAGSRPHGVADQFARLITDPWGFVPLGQVIVRAGPPGAGGPAPAVPEVESEPEVADPPFPFLEEFADAPEAMAGEDAPTTFAFGSHLPGRVFVDVPLTYEDVITNADGSGVVLQRTRCDTLAQVDAEGHTMPLGDDGTFEYEISHGDLIRSLAAVPMLWNTTAAGRLRAALDLVVFHPADPADPTRLPPGTTRFPLAVIVMGNHGVCATTTSGPADPPLGVGPTGLPLRTVHAATFGPEIPSHHGYSAITRGRPPGVVTGPATVPYLQEELAAHGIVSVSVSTNAANFFDLLLETRADLVLQAVAAMRRLNAERGGPFFRRLDFDRLAFVGHSRGGDAVIRAALKQRSLNVRALGQLAPTDISGLLRGATPAGVVGGRVDAVTGPMRVSAALEAFHLIAYGSRDGDVSGLEDVRASEFGDPFRHYDRSSAHRSFMFWHGATHNRFNRFWEDADEEPLLDLAAGGLLDRADQEARTSELVGSCLRFVLNREAAEAGRLDGRTPTAVAAAQPVAAMWKFGTRLATIDRFDDLQGDRNTLGGRNVPPASGLVDEVVLANENPPGAGISAFQFMHVDRVLRASLPSGPLPGTPGAPVAVASGRWRAQIPAADQDFRGFTLLTVRVTKKYNPAALAAGTALLPGVTLRLVDAARRTDEEAAAGRLSTLPAIRRVTLGTPPSTATLDLTKFHFETWEVELSLFGSAGVDLHHVVAVEIEMTGQGGEPIYVDTLSLVRR
jgi:hypothetical protein